MEIFFTFFAVKGNIILFSQFIALFLIKNRIIF